MENKIFAYMRISTNHKTQKVDRQQQTLIEYSVKNGFKIDDFFSDIIKTALALRKLKDGDGNYLWNHANDTILEKLEEMCPKGIRLFVRLKKLKAIQE